ncbi:hypothetical protein M409DRAFT_69686 [Zasmidium cellare ATCC 36951]|uniref:F-box domain-containing protein n=1 Tax=Zasmidium cellare ATCC 36951 TaxID=1080233 RepID=A0A6A6C5X7_ZASCE|nr:uncharacterized protein M409DRAFT_69686 [Zasmidium cellare ATCC 36951]KAF2161600.1 hypothetical protein M409DRAFT_69686 [Zasmidium cellare ATCC 36951]
MADTMDNAVDKCRLFKLPPELRNRIYRYVLATSDDKNPISVTNSGYERPHLLATCKTIRSEALGIHCVENTFLIHIVAFDSTPLYQWWSMMRRLGYGLSAITFKVRADWSTASWPNLRLWLRRVHRREVHGKPARPAALLQKGDTRAIKFAVGGLFAVAKELRGQPWAVAEAVLAQLRPSLIVLDGAWGKD